MPTPTGVPLSYNGYVTQLGVLAVMQTQTVGGIVQPVDVSLQALVPQAINYAELRIQRDLDLEQATAPNTSYSLTTGANLLTVAVNDFITVQGISYVSGTKTTPIIPASKWFIDTIYPDSATQGPPIYFAPYGGDSATTGATSQFFLFGPTPDQNYPLSMYGTIRMISLNSFGSSAGTAGSSYTFISGYLPDLLLMASMIYVSGFQRNFGKQSDDPAMAVSYEQQYGALLKGAMTEEARRKMWSSAWTGLSVPAAATKDR